MSMIDRPCKSMSTQLMMSLKHNELQYVDISDDEVPFEQLLTYRLLTLASRLNRQAIKIIESHHDLRLPEWRCLAMIGQNRVLHANRISEAAGMDRGLVSRAIQGLVAKGFVLAERDKDDRRIVRATLTKTGCALYEKLLPVMQQRQQRLLSALSPKDRKAVDRIIECLTQSLDEWEEDWSNRETG
jgi:DNA-binding MarR family transcriptional regulator